jgi:hypothetical protein
MKIIEIWPYFANDIDKYSQERRIKSPTKHILCLLQPTKLEKTVLVRPPTPTAHPMKVSAVV